MVGSIYINRLIFEKDVWNRKKEEEMIKIRKLYFRIILGFFLIYKINGVFYIRNKYFYILNRYKFEIIFFMFLYYLKSNII